MYAKAGDTFFTRSNSLLGRLIRWGERDKGEEAPWTNHMGVVVQDGWLGDSPLESQFYPKAIVIEALWKTRKGTWDGYKEGSKIRVFRPKPAYNPLELSRFQFKAQRYVGDTYGWWKLFGFLGRKITGIDIPEFFFIDKRPICSYLAGEVNEAAGRSKEPFGVPAQATEPEDALDFCIAHPELWEEIK